MIFIARLGSCCASHYRQRKTEALVLHDDHMADTLLLAEDAVGKQSASPTHLTRPTGEPQLMEGGPAA